MIKIAVVGSRSINNKDYIYNKLTNFLEKENLLNQEIEIVSGGAKGVDRIAQVYGVDNKYSVKVFSPQYNKYPKKQAPIMRNYQIVDYSDYIVVFWDGISRGSNMVINYVRTLESKGIDKKLFIFTPIT